MNWVKASRWVKGLVQVMMLTGWPMVARGETELPGSWQPAPQLGNGYIANQAKVLRRNCIKGVLVEVGQAIGELTYTSNASFEQIVKAFSGSVSTDVKVPFVNVKAGVEYAQANASTEHRMNWFLAFNAVPKSRGYATESIEVSDQGQKILSQRSNQVGEMCGDEYVHQVDYGAQLIATMSIEFASEEERNEFAAKVNVDVNFVVGSTNVSGEMSQMQKRMGSRTAVRVEAYQVGGRPGELTGILSQPLVNCTLTNIQACLNAFGRVIEYANGSFRQQLNDNNGLSVVRYRTLGYGDTNAWELIPGEKRDPLNELVGLQRERLNERFQKEALHYKRAKHVQQRFYQLITNEQMQQVQQIETKSFENMKRLTKGIEYCFANATQACVDQVVNVEEYDPKWLEVKVSEQVDPDTPLGKLFEAVKQGDINQVHRLLDRGGNQLMVQEDLEGYSPFHKAVQKGDWEMVEYLLGKDPYSGQGGQSVVHRPCSTGEGESPLCLVAQGGSSGHVRCIGVLCQKGGKLEEKSRRGKTPVQYSVLSGQEGTLEEFFTRGVNKQVKDSQERTLMHLAALGGNPAVLRRLVEEGFSVNTTDSQGATPLHWAAQAGQLRAIEYLVQQGADVTARDNQGLLALDWAVAAEQIEATEALWQRSLPANPLGVAKLQRTFTYGKDEVQFLVFSPDGQKLVAASPNNKAMHLWDAHTGQLLRILEGHTSGVTRVVFSLNGQVIASAGRDKTVRLWDGQTGQLLRTLHGHTDEVQSVAFSPDPDTQTLASGSEDKTVRLWNARTGELLLILEGHKNRVNSMAYSPDGQRLASSDSSVVRVWDTQTGDLLHTLQEDGGFHQMVFSLDGQKLEVTTYSDLIDEKSKGTVKAWNLHTGKSLSTWTGRCFYEYRCPNGYIFASRTRDQGKQVIQLRDTTTDQLLQKILPPPNGYNYLGVVTYSPDGQILAFADHHTIHLYTLQSETLLHRAVQSGKLDMVNWLLERVPGLTGIQNHQGQTPQDLALELGYTDIAERLSQYLQ